MKIRGSFEKNILISEYHTEKFSHEIEKEVPDNIDIKELKAEIVKLNAICEECVLREMFAHGFIAKEFLQNRIKTLEKLLLSFKHM